MRVWLDTETYNDLPISVGTYRYAETCEILIITYAIDDGEVQCIDLTNGGQADEFLTLCDRADELWAHNSMFDRRVLTEQLDARFTADWMRKWRDTMVQALCHGLPASLSDLSQMLGLSIDEAKHKEGRKLINLFCKNRKLRRATGADYPDQWDVFKAYAMSDIRAMRAVQGRIPTYQYPEKLVDHWLVDQAINDRGVMIDLPTVEAVIKMLELEKQRLADDTAERTRGEIRSTGQNSALREFIYRNYGADFDDLRKATVTSALEDMELHPEVDALLENRQQASKASTSKYKVFASNTNSDGVLRGSLQFSGASRTLRFAGRGIQLQNLPSRGLMPDAEVDALIPSIHKEVADLVCRDVMLLASSLIRKMIIARPGHKFIVSDWANVEGRLIAWVSRERWLVKAFSDFDKGTGHDLYKLTYAGAFNTDVEKVDKNQRNIGKVMTLFLGYGGGAGAFVNGALAYGFRMEELAASIWDTLPKDHRGEADSFYDWALKQKMPTYGLSRKAYVTADTLKRAWRAKHPKIAALWRGLEEAALQCCLTGQATSYLSVGFERRRKYLALIMPSGTALTYPIARVKDEKLQYWGRDQFTHKYGFISTFGGKLAENICQALGADLLRHTLARCEEEGLNPVLHVHDEVVCEVPEETDNDRLTKAMLDRPQWAKGLPMAAETFEAKRYRK